MWRQGGIESVRAERQREAESEGGEGEKQNESECGAQLHILILVCVSKWLSIPQGTGLIVSYPSHMQPF